MQQDIQKNWESDQQQQEDQRCARGVVDVEQRKAQIDSQQRQQQGQQQQEQQREEKRREEHLLAMYTTYQRLTSSFQISRILNIPRILS